MKFDVVCRICLKEGLMKSVFDTFKTEGDRKVYCSEMLRTLITFKVDPSDGYPEQLCKHCINKLWSAYKFQRLCVSSYEYLTNYMLENKPVIKLESNEDDCPLIDFVARCDETEQDKDTIVESYIKVEMHPSSDDKDDIPDMSYNMDDYDCNDAEETLNMDNELSSEKADKKKKKYKKDGKFVKRLVCPRCCKKFRNKLSYLRHEDTHMLSDFPEIGNQKNHKCSECGVKFYFKEILSKHEKCHKVRSKQYSLREEKSCTHCSRKFKNNLSLLKHIDQHLGVSSGDKFKCTYCSKMFKEKSLFLKHEASHLGLKPYYCETCKKSYRSEVDHKAYCGLELAFKCDYCAKRFKTKSRLISHIRTHNTNRKKFVCDQEGCKKEFISQPGFMKHKKLHTGEKFMCHLCSKEFTDKYQLQSHINRHNNNRKYPCSYCEKRFFTSGAKLEHERRHTNTRNFACTQCDKKFVSSTNLKRHTLWHEKNFNEQCRFCEKRFLVRGNRQTHEAIMHGVTKTIDESKYFCQQRLKATRLPKISIDA